MTTILGLPTDPEAIALLILSCVGAGAAFLFASGTISAYYKKESLVFVAGSFMTMAAILIFWLFFSPLVGIHYNL
jgi:hypothetical protein